MRERARAMAEAVGLDDSLDALVAELSHGEQRQLEVGMARAAEPKLMMLDEPAAGLSRAERVQLTELLLELDPAITLILIEHDMDVALRVAEWVTMMHDGRVIVEGTPDEIRANETVHELYLGSREPMSEPLLEVEDLNGYYGTAHVLQGVSFSMGAEPVALIGRNGMGKSTLCAGDHRAARARRDGSVRLDGRELLGRPAYKIAGAGIGFVPAGPAAVPVADRRRAPARSSARRVERGLDARSASTSSSRGWPSART